LLYAKGDVLERVEITILRGNFHGAAPAAGAKVVATVRIGHLGPIDFDGVIVKAFVERSRVAVPRAVLAFGELTAVAESAGDALRLRRYDAQFHAPPELYCGYCLPAWFEGHGFQSLAGALVSAAQSCPPRIDAAAGLRVLFS
jgi:hypothetical protein